MLDVQILDFRQLSFGASSLFGYVSGCLLYISVHKHAIHRPTSVLDDLSNVIRLNPAEIALDRHKGHRVPVSRHTLQHAEEAADHIHHLGALWKGENIAEQSGE